ncbi:mannosyltransferase putative-domain-containing protein [Dunaliella salina]|nr:mannosyltransferase putative-domain-containing protein [Dunaliella salina]|eukprot:KAF5825970.1 mannosyltransferase putative-domain-containing protein [Dunaliella salina]
MLKVLREHVKCTLPVEVAYRGTEDMQNDTLLQLIALFNPLDGLDLLQLPRLPHEMRLPSMGGWVAKTRALLYSRFQKVLMLDVDVVPLINPATLFAAPEFLAHGNIFWSDSWDSWVSDSAFHMLGLKRTETQGILNKGKGKLPHDTESGIVMFDRVRHSDVLHYLWFINTFAPKVYQHLHGDKDTFALSFALCGRKVNQFFQLDTPPGGAFHWGQGVLENKTVGEGEDGRYTDGWQLVGFVQHSPIQPAAPAFLHRTMNKWNINEEPWPVSVISGPMPPSWTKFYLAHDSIGQTKGRWWEHVAPGFALLIAGPPHSQQGNFQPAHLGEKLEEDALESPSGSNPSQEHISGDQTRAKACQIETLYKLLSPINASLIKHDDDKPDPLPAIHASLPNYPVSLVPAVQKSGCESSFIAIRAAYRAHKWLQDEARSMFLQMDH